MGKFICLLWQHCRRPWSSTCEPCSFDRGKTGFVWVRRVSNGSTDPKSRQTRAQRCPTALLFVVNISPSFAEFTAPLRHILPIHNFTINSNNLFVIPLDVHLLGWEIVSWNAPRIWRDFGSALPFQTLLNQTKPFVPLSNEHGSQVNDQGRRQCYHNKHKRFQYRPTRDVSLLPDTPRTCDAL